jgi:hypothetical protein
MTTRRDAGARIDRDQELVQGLLSSGSVSSVEPIISQAPEKWTCDREADGCGQQNEANSVRCSSCRRIWVGSTQEYSPNERVLALYKPDQWFAGVVEARLQKDSYLVRYDDNDSKVVHERNLQREPAGPTVETFAPGDIVRSATFPTLSIPLYPLGELHAVHGVVGGRKRAVAPMWLVSWISSRQLQCTASRTHMTR